MSNTAPANDSAAVAAKPGFFTQVSSFPSAFWVANIIELVERFSFWGIRTIAALYIITEAEKGGLGFNNTDKGLFFGTWSLIQCLLPMFTGGFSDRYGYRVSLLIAFTINIIGYVLMAFMHSWWGFMAACCMIGTGTAIFKPPLHGTLAHCVSEKNSSVGWGIFYQVVNIGAFFGPIAMGRLRLLEWRYAFFLSAGIILINVLITGLFLKDYSQGRKAGKDGKGSLATFVESMSILARETKFVIFLGIFSGFWFMFMMLSDQVAIFISQWVNTNDIATFFAQLTGWEFFKNLAKDGGQFNPEWIVAIDAFSIMLLVSLLSYLVARFRHISVMIAGMCITCVGLVSAASATTGWMCALGVFVFAIGEMMCGPKFSEYVSRMAPPDKKALYMGYSNIPSAIGWAGTNFVGGVLYQHLADKVELAQRHLIGACGMNEEAVMALGRGEVMPLLSSRLNMSEAAVTRLLYQEYHPQYFFYLVIIVGVLSTLALLRYHFWLEAEKKRLAPATA